MDVFQVYLFLGVSHFHDTLGQTFDQNQRKRAEAERLSFAGSSGVGGRRDGEPHGVSIQVFQHRSPQALDVTGFLIHVCCDSALCRGVTQWASTAQYSGWRPTQRYVII